MYGDQRVIVELDDIKTVNTVSDTIPRKKHVTPLIA
jgi:hypothetical protein